MQLCELKIKQIRISGDNPRIINKKSEEFLELVSSIKSMGVKVPIHVREKTSGKYDYELIAGERRLLAAGEAGLVTIPALNHGELSDDAAFEVTFAENFAREDLTILEQGKAVATLMAKFKDDIVAVASKIGKPEQWVRQRELINSNLSEKWKKLVLENPDYSYFTAAHLGLIARFPQHIQDGEIVKSLQYCHVTVKELDKKLAELFLLLKKAPFDTGKCVNCTKRSSCQPTLWAEKPEEVTGEKDRCLDKKCWLNKDVATAKEKLAEVQAEYPGLVYVEGSGCYEQDTIDRNKKIYGKSLSRWQYEKVKKTDKGAVPALVIDDSGKGKILYVNVKVKKGQEESAARPPGKPKTLKQLRAELEENRWAAVLKEMYSEIMKLKPEDIKHPDKFFIIVVLATGLGIDTSAPNDSAFITQAIDLFRKDAKKAKCWLQAQIWKSTQEAMRYSYTDGNKEEIELGRIIAPLLGIDLDEKYKEVCSRDEFKEPAEWANLKADGTPKEISKSKDKKSKTKKVKLETADKVKKCRICGCTEENPCQTSEEPCHWIEGHGDLCSGCAGKNK